MRVSKHLKTLFIIISYFVASFCCWFHCNYICYMQSQTKKMATTLTITTTTTTKEKDKKHARFNTSRFDCFHNRDRKRKKIRWQKTYSKQKVLRCFWSVNSQFEISDRSDTTNAIVCDFLLFKKIIFFVLHEKYRFAVLSSL